MSRFIRFGTKLINIHHVRTIEYETSFNAKKHYVTMRYQGHEGLSGSFLFFSSPDIYDRWTFNSKEEAATFLNDIDRLITKN